MFGKVVFGVLTAVVLVFVVQNMETVQVHFLTWKVNASRSLVLILTFLAGVLAGWISRRPREKRKKEPKT